MFCKHTGCTETTVTAPQVSPLSEKMTEKPHVLLLPKYLLVNWKLPFHTYKIHKMQHDKTIVIVYWKPPFRAITYGYGSNPYQ